MRAYPLCLILMLAACGSTPSEEEASAEPYTLIESRDREEKSMGLYLADISASLLAWTTKTATASTQKERHKQELLELTLKQQVNERRIELIGELETGPPQNRIVAAGALGFSKKPDVLGPLIAALDDSEPRVVTNSLMSIGVLASRDTPLPPLCEILQLAPDPAHRWSAANALINVLRAGAVDDSGCAMESGRVGLTDEEPMVRTQSALILAQVMDVESLDQIAGLLYDRYPLVTSAAARAIGHIGTADPHAKGRAAHLLFEALASSEKKRQLMILDDLVTLSERNYELDIEKWRDWVERMPEE